jgi:hypothetical protein
MLKKGKHDDGISDFEKALIPDNSEVFLILLIAGS